MHCPLIYFTESVIFSLKSGRPLSATLKHFEQKHPHYLQKHKIKLNKEPSDPYTMTYELILILRRGQTGLPILKSLEDFHTRLYEHMDLSIEEHSKKAPFRALIPLFLFQVPSLFLLFFYPLMNEFLKELAL